MIWRSDCLLKPVVTRYLPLQAHTIRALFMAWRMRGDEWAVLGAERPRGKGAARP